MRYHVAVHDLPGRIVYSLTVEEWRDVERAAQAAALSRRHVTVTRIPSLWDRIVAAIPDRPTRVSRIIGGMVAATAVMSIFIFAAWLEHTI